MTTDIAACNCHSFRNASRCPIHTQADFDAQPLTLGAQVIFAEDEEHTTSLGVISRVWDNGKYVSLVCDGHLYVRLIERVQPCR